MVYLSYSKNIHITTFHACKAYILHSLVSEATMVNNQGPEFWLKVSEYPKFGWEPSLVIQCEGVRGFYDSMTNMNKMYQTRPRIKCLHIAKHNKAIHQIAHKLQYKKQTRCYILVKPTQLAQDIGKPEWLLRYTCMAG